MAISTKARFVTMIVASATVLAYLTWSSVPFSTLNQLLASVSSKTSGQDRLAKALRKTTPTQTRTGAEAAHEQHGVSPTVTNNRMVVPHKKKNNEQKTKEPSNKNNAQNKKNNKQKTKEPNNENNAQNNKNNKQKTKEPNNPNNAQNNKKNKQKTEEPNNEEKNGEIEESLPEVCPENTDRSKCHKWHTSTMCNLEEILNTIECNTSAPLDDLVTVLHENMDTSMMRTMQQSLRSKYGVLLVFADSIDDIKTKYTVVLRNESMIDIDCDVLRHIRLISEGKADIVGGAHVDPELRWGAGCYQFGILPYTLSITEGYESSFESCIRCDYLSGPFFIKTDRLKAMHQELTLDWPDLSRWLNFFMIARKHNLTAISCPDSQFRMLPHLFSLQNPKSALLPFAKHWKWNRIRMKFHSLRRSLDVKFTCKEAGATCGTKKGVLLPLCCMELVKDCVLRIVHTLDEANIRYGLVAGTALGPIKFQYFLPWEVDNDIRVSDEDASKIFELKETFEAANMSLRPQGSREGFDRCRKKKNHHCGYFHAYCKGIGWRSELWGMDKVRFGREEQYLKDLPRSKLSWGGNFLDAFGASPGRGMRIHYSDDIYAHMEHPSYGREQSSGSYAKCPSPGFHGCVNTMPTTGSLKFVEWLDGY